MGKIQKNANDILRWQESLSVKGREELFLLKDILCEPVLKSWQNSMFAHEWLDEKGKIKKPEEMPESERLKRQDIKQSLKQEEPLSYPVLGIGINENIEIGSGRAVFLTLAAEGYKSLPVYIPKSCLYEFKEFLA